MPISLSISHQAEFAVSYLIVEDLGNLIRKPDLCNLGFILFPPSL